jgi:hypothetical protein
VKSGMGESAAARAGVEHYASLAEEIERLLHAEMQLLPSSVTVDAAARSQLRADAILEAHRGNVQPSEAVGGAVRRWREAQVQVRENTVWDTLSNVVSRLESKPAFNPLVAADESRDEATGRRRDAEIEQSATRER